MSAKPKPESDLSRFTKLARTNDYVVLDTETTALETRYARIVQIAIVDASGKPLLSTLIDPKIAIPNSHIHGITDEMVKESPTFEMIAPMIHDLLHGRNVIIYNAQYDTPILVREFLRAQVTSPTFSYHCAMLAWSEHYGDWNDYHGNYRWQKLTNAASDIGYTLPDGMSAHSALADCLMTLAVTQYLASRE
jgi:DNA polymerase-3 subunit epsilon